MTSCVVVTAMTDDGPIGCLVASVMPVGYRTGTVVVALTEGSRTERGLRETPVLGLTVLSARDIATARTFTEPCLRPTDRFDGIEWALGSLGAPVLSGGIAAVEARVTDRYRAAGCALLVATVAVRHGAPVSDADPMTISDARRAGLE